jgi:hypothetical protein
MANLHSGTSAAAAMLMNYMVPVQAVRPKLASAPASEPVRREFIFREPAYMLAAVAPGDPTTSQDG